jgi:hypothetical protein
MGAVSKALTPYTLPKSIAGRAKNAYAQLVLADRRAQATRARFVTLAGEIGYMRARELLADLETRYPASLLVKSR